MSCYTCKYWQFPYTDYVFDIDEWSEEYKEALDEGGTCDCPKLMESDGEEPDLMKSESLIALNASAIWTGPNYHCLHWVERD